MGACGTGMAMEEGMTEWWVTYESPGELQSVGWWGWELLKQRKFCKGAMDWWWKIVSGVGDWIFGRERGGEMNEGEMRGWRRRLDECMLGGTKLDVWGVVTGYDGWGWMPGSRMVNVCNGCAYMRPCVSEVRSMDSDMKEAVTALDVRKIKERKSELVDSWSVVSDLGLRLGAHNL